MEQRQDEAQDWQTPPGFLALVREVFGGPIGLDPCTTPSNPTQAKRWYAPPQDGLELPWLGLGPVFVNPPYGRGIGAWTARMATLGNGGEGIALLPARTDTAWWHRDIVGAKAVCFLQGRVRFVDARTGMRQGAGKFPSAVAYWGHRVTDFCDAFDKEGWIP